MFHTSDGRKVIENLDEFDDAREVVSGLAAEYAACERPDYVSLATHAMLDFKSLAHTCHARNFCSHMTCLITSMHQSCTHAMPEFEGLAHTYMCTSVLHTCHALHTHATLDYTSFELKYARPDLHIHCLTLLHFRGCTKPLLFVPEANLSLVD